MTDLALPPLFVSRYSNHGIADHPELAPIRFTRGHPRFKLRYELAGTILELAPTRDEFALGGDHDAFTAAYRSRLDTMDHVAVGHQITEIVAARPGATGAVMLCFEDVRLPGELCHRSIFAAWWKDRTGQTVPELANPAPPQPKRPSRGGGRTSQLTLL